MPEQNQINQPILVVEPSKLYQEMLDQQIRAAGLRACYVPTLGEATDKVREHEFKLIICCRELSDGSSFDLAKVVRGEVGSNIPILLLTSSSDKALLATAFDNGITEVISRSRLVELQVYLSTLVSTPEIQQQDGGNILFVEDMQSIVDYSKEVFEQNGYQFSSCSSAEQAIELLANNEFDLVISDILLAGKMTGIALVRYIKKQPAPTNRIPILAVSGLDKSDHKLEALRQGVSDFINKPIDYEELLVRSRNLIQSKRLYDRVVAQEAQLREMAITDPLTQLYNRHYLNDTGLKRVKEANRHRQDLSILVIDLDHFKKINDNQGHAVGDQVLVEVGALLLKNCRGEDFAVRYGGEEFILMLPHCGEADAVAKAEALRQALIQLKPAGTQVTASFGVASLSSKDPEATFKELFERADKAVYQAKSSGRNKVCSAILN